MFQIYKKMVLIVSFALIVEVFFFVSYQSESVEFSSTVQGPPQTRKLHHQNTLNVGTSVSDDSSTAQQRWGLSTENTQDFVGRGPLKTFEVSESSDNSLDFSNQRQTAKETSSTFNDEDEMYSSRSVEKDALYEAYNLLHTLAQDFRKPFDAPAVVVVGHQSSGKSALIEALMGFQFNQVGGGTKTRRPVALRMQYNPKCVQPRCFLQGDDGVERPMSLASLQEYIQSENERLAKDPMRCFDPREINIRMEYKYCPNMILIDTPGLIAAPRQARGQPAPNLQQRALQASAREAERLVVQKMRCPDYIILCVEDTADWKHGATREIVQKADPDLSRTVIVQTKLDTKIPQFGTAADVLEFLSADIITQISPNKMGGPFFTSVPSGRVLRSDMANEDSVFENDDDFVVGCSDNEDRDRSIISQRMARLVDQPTVNTNLLLSRVGLSRLRGFLEQKVDEQYRKNVAKIVPLLQAEHANALKKLNACERELDALSVDRLRHGAEKFCDEFCAALKEAVQGTIAAPPSLFGETLQQENLASGSFNEIQSCPMVVSSRTWERLVLSEVGNAEHRLFGGAQYHRVLREFTLATRCLRLPAVSEDEIANAAGLGDRHDGVNFLRAACMIAVEKAQTSFDPMLEALRMRCVHIMGKMYFVSEFMLRQKRERNLYSYPGLVRNDGAPTSETDITQNNLFKQLVRTIYEKFTQKCSDSVMTRCRDDLTALTRFVSWDLGASRGGGGGGALRRSLPDQTDIVTVYQVALKSASEKGKSLKSKKSENMITERKSPSSVVSAEDSQIERDYNNLVQIVEEALCSRDSNRTNLVVGGLVQHIITQWRESFCKEVITKFNCFFLMPYVDDFQVFFRQELQKMYESDLGDVFNLSNARRQLQQQREQLLNECEANKRLQDKFDQVSRMMREQQETLSPSHDVFSWKTK